VPRVARHTLPGPVVLEGAAAVAVAARHAGVAGATMPHLQGAAGRSMLHALGARGVQAAFARMRVGRFELVFRDVWAELERRGATVATVPFSGRAGLGGTVATITLSRVDGGEPVDVERPR